MKIHPYRMINKIQHHAWGMKNRKAFIPRLIHEKIIPDRPYAELWMGVHANGPSFVETDAGPISLESLIRRNPEKCLGSHISIHFDDRLPFLFKLLSAGRPLSIQVHPTRAQARQIHAEDPEHYPDSNHKPEIAIALDQLTALFGFYHAEKMRMVLTAYPEIADYIETVSDSPTIIIRSLIKRSLVDTERLAAQIHLLASRLNAQTVRTDKDQIFLKAYDPCSGPDIGLFLIFLMHLITLQSGEAIFIRPGMPHAYLYGNILECMASSDNVLRAGMTPKFKDITRLLRCMETEPIVPAIIRPETTQSVFTYPAKADEFSVIRCRFTSGKEMALCTHDRPMILISVEGNLEYCKENEKQIIRQGDAYFFPAALNRFRIKSHEKALCFFATAPRA